MTEVRAPASARDGPTAPWPLLSVSDVAVSFGPLRALDGVDLAVRPGEIVALAGENGAGKTTLVRCIAGDIAPTSGEIVLDGGPVTRDPAAGRAAGHRRGLAGPGAVRQPGHRRRT